MSQAVIGTAVLGVVLRVLCTGQGADMAAMMPISEAKGRLSELVRDADLDDALLLRHGRVAAVMMSARRHDALMEELEDLRDRLSIHEREGVTLDFDKLRAELGV